MERTPGENPEVDADGVWHSKRKTRRRLIQSKLFPSGSQENRDVDGSDGEGEQTEEADGEEFGVKKSKSKKRKLTTPKRTPRKAQVTNKKARGAKKGSLFVTVRSDFFVKVSERKLQQKQESEQQGMADLTAGSEELDKNFRLLAGKECEQQMNEEADGNVKSCKNGMLEAGKSPHLRRRVKDNVSNVASGLGSGMPKAGKNPHRRRKVKYSEPNAANCLSTKNVSMSQTAFDLRLEAKIASEEYARMYAGKQTHPFFSSWKTVSRLHESAKTTSKWCSFTGGDGITSCPPVHVFEALQDDRAFTDWKDWEFCERTLCHSAGYNNIGHACSSASIGSVRPLKFDSFSAISSSNYTSFLQEVDCLDHLPDQRESTLALSANGCSMLPDGEEAQEPLFSFLKDQENQKNGFVGDAEDERTRFRVERSHHCNWTGCSLWTNKYQPENASEVCGNGESIKFLSDWLRSWNENVPQSSKCSTSRDSDIQESDGWYPSDSDSENIDGGSASKNVLLITGPVGSGKSTAVYACAKEQGFDVIEVNSSEWRNGASVKQKFGGVMESHGFNKWSFKGSILPQRKNNVELFLQSNSTAAEESDCQIIDTISTSRQEPVHLLEQLENTTDKKTTAGQGAKKTLILFEDVDIIFGEDRGFIASLLHLAETAKRPMILTSNSKTPVLPPLLTRQVVEFTLPSLHDLLSAIHVVCVAEKVYVPSQLLERFIRCCKYDIRKTITLLQFWCQGSIGQEDQKMQCTYSPLQFDIDAAHQIIPKVLPWGFPWELSNEVSQSLSLVKDGELNYNIMLDHLDMDNNRTDIKARKEAMLRNCSDNDIDGSASQLDYVDASESPVTFTRRTAQRKQNAVFYSDSEDDGFCTGNLLAISEIPSKDDNYEVSLDMSAVPLSRLSSDLSPENFEPSTDQIFYPNHCNLDQELNRCPETLSDSLVDISHVPESSFVHEDEVNDGNGCPSAIVSSGNFSFLEDSLTNMKAIQSLAVAEAMHIDESVAEPMSGNFRDLDSESPHENMELEISESEETETAARGYPVMDECSRADFRFGCAFMENPPCPPLVDQVQQTWRKLHGCDKELKLHITTEQKDSFQIVELASRMSNLISEADVMFNGCQPLTSDSLDPVVIPCVEPAAASWYDEQVVMTSTLAEHGFCFYMKEIAASHKNQVDLTQEMLASSNNIMALGKLARKEMSKIQNLCNLQMESPQIENFSRREVGLRSYGTILSIVPAKSRMSLKGATLHEYLCSLSQISRADASRLSEGCHRKRKCCRGRGFRHYLCGGSFALSPEEVNLLAQYGCYGEDTSKGR